MPFNLMDAPSMRDIALQVGGSLAVLCAIAHGYLGESKVFAAATISPPQLRILLRLVWQCGSVAWIGFGILLFFAPTFNSDPARRAIISTAIVAFACGALGNAWATRGSHFGWIALLAVCLLAGLGW